MIETRIMIVSHIFCGVSKTERHHLGSHSVPMELSSRRRNPDRDSGDTSRTFERRSHGIGAKAAAETAGQEKDKATSELWRVPYIDDGVDEGAAGEQHTCERAHIERCHIGWNGFYHYEQRYRDQG
jgi:hypothetical protein